MAEREEISRAVAAGVSCRQIAARLGRAPSTVSRELIGNGGRGRYRAQAADAAAFRRAQRPKPAKLVTQPRLRAVSPVIHRTPCSWPSQPNAKPTTSPAIGRLSGGRGDTGWR